MNLKIISAGAGSGKTYRLTQEMVGLLRSGVRASGVIATTFTTKAAAELQERVRVKLLEEGLVDEANALTNALIGTVHGLGVKLLKRFAFLAGVSPQVDIIADEDQQIFFNRSLATVLRLDRIREMEKYSVRLGLSKNDYYDWRQEIKRLTDTARANDFSTEILLKSRDNSIKTLTTFLGTIASVSGEVLSQNFANEIRATIDRLEANEDTTKKTATVVDTLKGMLRKIDLGDSLNWHEWVKISKLSVGAKSKDDIADLIALAHSHDTHPEFHADIKNYLTTIFDIAIEAIQEYETYKKQRGLIDYIDMEIQVNRLLDQATVREILASELDLLMVDEFQDTSPIQLEIFLKLSQIAKYSVWVGDPKQSIYGFRGAEPRLMMEIIKQNGGVKKEDIQEYSWRSREDIVHLTNAIFTKAFKDLPKEQIPLKPKRTKADNPEDPNFKGEPLEMQDALINWHFEFDGEGREPGKDWTNGALAVNVQKMIAREVPVIDRNSGKMRKVQPGDIAVLCRTNKECLNVAEALHQAGLKAAIARTGLLDTAEAKLILACLKYMLHRSDSLSIAEILLLGANKKIEKIIKDRLEWLELDDEKRRYHHWSSDQPLIKKLNNLRSKASELSSTEMLNLLLEVLDLRRIMAHWGNIPQRMDNVDMLRKFALQYEDNCNRLHAAASLGGFLLYLNEMAVGEKDARGSGEGTDAVNLLTYHRSKGLEWPVVICHNLENGFRDNLWGMNIVAESDQVDLNNILGNRWLRYWINPYGQQLRGTSLAERIEASPEQEISRYQGLQEEARLLYVGITRARDYLVFPSRNRPTTRWLNRCCHEGDEARPTLDQSSSESIWTWNDQPVIIHPEVTHFGRDFPQVENEEGLLTYFEKRPAGKSYLPYLIDPDNYYKRGSLKVNPDIFKGYSNGPVVADIQNLHPLAQLITDFFLADDPVRAANQRLLMAEELITRYEAEDFTNSIEICQWSKQFYQQIDQYGKGKIYRSYPLQLKIGSQVFETTIDWLIVTKDQCIIIKNSKFAGKKDRYSKHTKDKAGWFALCERGIREIFAIQKVIKLVHFALGGGLLNLKVTEKSPKKLL